MFRGHKQMLNNQQFYLNDIKDVFMNEKRRVSLNCQKAFDTIRFD